MLDEEACDFHISGECSQLLRPDASTLPSRRTLPPLPSWNPKHSRYQNVPQQPLVSPILLGLHRARRGSERFPNLPILMPHAMESTYPWPALWRGCHGPRGIVRLQLFQIGMPHATESYRGGPGPSHLRLARRGSERMRLFLGGSKAPRSCYACLDLRV